MIALKEKKFVVDEFLKKTGAEFIATSDDGYTQLYESIMQDCPSIHGYECPEYCKPIEKTAIEPSSIDKETHHRCWIASIKNQLENMEN